MFISSYRVTKFAFQNFWRNFWLSIITVSMLLLTLVTINILLFLNVVTDRAIELVEDRIEVSVYFYDYTEDTTVSAAVAYLRGLGQVRDVEVVSAEEAYTQFVARHADDEEIMASLEELGENPFGSSLIVKAHQAEDFTQIIDALDNPQFRDFIREKDFSDYQNIVERIRSTTDRIRAFGIALAVIFLLIAILIVFNTVRIGIFIHREEIGIMRLVGASNWFIKAPFLLEMIFLSLFAVGLAALIVYPTVAIIEPQLSVYFSAQSAGLVDYFAQNGLLIFGGQFLALVLVTLFSTGLAMGKYLKV
ncbi:FtsX-like permease family protein [Patescibacteria group bacterium]|nr:MAG: FtsX-like permease family protein [Patescibacteria group bacterium]